MHHDVELTVALSDNAMTAGILEGAVVPDGVSWTPLTLHPSELFWRQLRFGEFDVFEMGMSSVMRFASLGEKRWVALPVFTARQLCHTGIVVTEASGISAPADLRGRRIGVPEYQQTSAIWSRGVLQQDFGVDPRDVTWVMERGAQVSHGDSTGFRPPEGVTVEVMDEGDSIGSLLAAGRLDGSLLYLSEQNLVDRSPAASSRDLGVHRLFEPAAERRRYLGGRAPHAAHCVAISLETAERHPWLVLNVYSAFLKAKEFARARAEAALAPWAEADDSARAALDAVREQDAAPYGVAANRDMLETLFRYAAEQGIAERLLTIEDVFAPQTLGL